MAEKEAPEPIVSGDSSSSPSPSSPSSAAPSLRWERLLALAILGAAKLQQAFTHVELVSEMVFVGGLSAVFGDPIVRYVRGRLGK